MNLPIASVLGLGTLTDNGVTHTCIDCRLNFTTGNLKGTTPTSWTFAAGGTITLTGGIDLDNDGGSDVPPGSVLMNGQFVADTTVRRLVRTLTFAAGSFAGTTLPLLAAAYQLPDTGLAGGLNLSFNASASSPRTFVSTIVFGSNVTSCVVVAADGVE